MFPENFYLILISIIYFSSEKNGQNVLNLQGMVTFLQDRCSTSDKSFIAMEIQSKLDHG